MDLAFEYLAWAIVQVREEYGVKWPPVRREDVRTTVESYRDGGTVVVAETGGTPVGIGAVRRLDEQTAEIKRMYVREEARGLGAGSAILDRLLTAAGDLGAATVKLDTVQFLSDAQRLYRSRGFSECPPYPGSEIPPELRHHWLFFERPLTP